jgi:gluconate 5-dehydrogenase
MMQQVVKQSMLPQKFGAIVNIASMAGIRGMTPPMCSAHYSASKGAVVAVTMQAAVEWAAAGIRANVIAPGGVMSGGAGVHLPSEGKPGPGGPGSPADGPGGPPTTGVPTGRLSDPEEIAGMALYLLSEWSENTTGQVVVIDGGSTAVGY